MLGYVKMRNSNPTWASLFDGNVAGTWARSLLYDRSIEDIRQHYAKLSETARGNAEDYLLAHAAIDPLEWATHDGDQVFLTFDPIFAYLIFVDPGESPRC